MEYIIIQAGGKGTRLKELTKNKPKAIVSVNNLPIIYHLFKKYPTKKYVIIGDYLKNVLDNYLEAFPMVSYVTVDANGYNGTCAGIRKALKYIPNNKRFMLIWSDLILGKQFEVPPDATRDYIGISNSFPCRWSFINDTLQEVASDKQGVAGLFIFTDKTKLKDVPESGEFVRWLQSSNMILYPHTIENSAEYGLIEKIEQKESGKCRPFNSMTILENKIIKEGIDEKGRELAIREKKWYNHVKPLNIPIPKIYSFEPLTIERINGKNIFEYEFSDYKKNIVLIEIMNGLKKIHCHNHTESDTFSLMKTYYNKTFERLDTVRNLIPLSNEKYIVINGKKCKNVYFYREKIRNIISEMECDEFCLIHGDCTFSNIMLKNDKFPIFIDPRGYFGDCELVGDPAYDWAKLYYSIIGNYDQFNLGKFSWTKDENYIELNIKSNGWENTEQTFIDNLPTNISIEKIRFIHALIWLSLTTYAWDDYDSICGAFYKGVYCMEEFI